ncbi:MAG: hypothetical protein BGN88_01840 [Clostridiales bacterium 43-6]|nr:MAG: hypothetical protein BGN88_01840 [Clostridiales bacterium 43-6]
MAGIKANQSKAVLLDEDFINPTVDFSVELFKKSVTKGKNSLISPVSVYLALGMAAGGANGTTLAEFEKLLGGQNLKQKDLNLYYRAFSKSLTDDKEGKLTIANSVWYRDDGMLEIKKDFLQTNADYYGAGAFKADFNATKTVDEINNWVKTNTDGQIDKIVDKIDSLTECYLFNTLYFEAEWDEIYYETDKEQAKFTLSNGKHITTEYMKGKESSYLANQNCTGFLKPYRGEKYSFVALLPNQGVTMDKFITSLSGKTFLELLHKKSEEKVITKLPKFRYQYDFDLNSALRQLGLKTAFNESADFGSMSEEKLFLYDVRHKTSIHVYEKGTKAGAASVMEIWKMGLDMDTDKPKEVILDRPFVYAIIDNKTSLPIFMGTMMDPSKE